MPPSGMEKKKEYPTQKPTGSADHDFMFRRVHYHSIQNRIYLAD